MNIAGRGFGGCDDDCVVANVRLSVCCVQCYRTVQCVGGGKNPGRRHIQRKEVQE